MPLQATSGTALNVAWVMLKMLVQFQSLAIRMLVLWPPKPKLLLMA